MRLILRIHAALKAFSTSTRPNVASLKLNRRFGEKPADLNSGAVRIFRTTCLVPAADFCRPPARDNQSPIGPESQ
jgi:hypothetical protein